MKQDLNIHEIRRMLQRYYAANATAEEEQTLVKFFIGTSADDLPADLRADASMFQSLAIIASQPNNVEAPSSLLDNLNDVVEGKPRKRMWLKLTGAGVAAAAVLWAVFTIEQGDRLNEVAKDQSTELVAEVIAEDVTNESDASESSATLASAEQFDDACEPASKPTTKPAHKPSVRPVQISAEEVDDDGFIEITNPEDALKITREVGNLLAANLNSSEKALAKVNSSIETYSTLTQNFIQ